MAKQLPADEAARTRQRDKNDLRLTAAEYFAGIGLIRMGLGPFGWKVVFANDISAKKYEMYQAFFPDAEQHYTVDDIFNIEPNTVPPTLLATCSFPCIDLSLAGNMKGIKGEHSNAFWGFINVLRSQGENSPPLILVENVPGWLCSNNGRDFRLAIQALTKFGYACDVFTLDARRFTPQSRLRIFLIGTKWSMGAKSALDRMLQRPQSLLTDRLKKCLIANRSLRWFYNDLPTPPLFRDGGLSSIVEKLRSSDTRWWSQEKVARHVDMMKKAHRDMVIQFARSGRITYRAFFRRRREGEQRVEARQDDLAGCLRTAVGGSGKQFLIKAGRGRIDMRAMTPREYARLQGVPDKYPITINGTQALTGLGDAVCVPVISWIARNVLKPLVKKYVHCARAA